MARKDVNSQASARNRERRLKALDYYVYGLPYRAIGEKLGVSYQQAFRDVKAALSEIEKLEKETASDLIRREREWLDFQRRGIVAKVGKGEIGAGKLAIQNSESFRRMYGLDAPQKYAPTTPDGHEEAGSKLASAFEKIAARLAPEMLDGGTSGSDSEPDG